LTHARRVNTRRPGPVLAWFDRTGPGLQTPRQWDDSPLRGQQIWRPAMPSRGKRREFTASLEGNARSRPPGGGRRTGEAPGCRNRQLLGSPIRRSPLKDERPIGICLPKEGRTVVSTVHKQLGQLFYKLIYAVGIFLCPAAGLRSKWKSRFMAEISNRLRYTSTAENAGSRRVESNRNCREVLG